MINIRTLNVGNVIRGCYTANEIKAGKIEETDEVAMLQRERLTICSTCPLNVDSTCHRDTDNVFQDESDFTVEQLMERRTLVNVKTKRLVFGCGCILVCKTVLKTEKCPAGKW